MNLAIVGYGKMGRLLEQLAPDYGFAVRVRLNGANNKNAQGITPENFRDVDIALEFSVPGATLGNIERLAALGVHAVVGTTGWFEHLDRAREAVAQAGTGLVWAANYSIGMNAFFRIVGEAARLLANHPDYGAWARELHHAAKKDSPSGTLLKLIEEMKKAGYARPVATGAIRAGAHPGLHEIGFDSASDTITLSHMARNREGYARGALRAARWLAGKKGFFEFREIVDQLN
jgi:4-hydroxy-tetrahydrodipicolinate reductase